MKFSLGTLKFVHMGQKLTVIHFYSAYSTNVDVYFTIHEDKLVELYHKLDMLMRYVSYQYPQIT